jgi:preprotein translocase subunit YajC
MFRGRKKQRQQQEQMKSELRPGAQVMTQFGLFGTVVSIDEAENKVVLELSPGSTATVHTQAVARIMPDEDPDAAEAGTPAAEAETFPADSAAPSVETPEETRRRLEGNDTKE